MARPRKLPRHKENPVLFPKQPPPRECAECSACCNVYHIDGLFPESPRWVDCYHQGERGCGIHGHPKRPPACGGFLCMWLDGWGEEDDRPDRLGLVLDYNRARPRIDVVESVTAIEAAPGRSDEPRARARLRELRAVLKVLLVPHGARGLDNFGHELPADF